MAAGTSAGQRRTRTPGGRTVRVVVRVTTEEYATLTGHAAREGLTVPSYLAALGLNPQQVPAGELRSALTHAAALRRLLATALSHPDQRAAPEHDVPGGLTELSRQAQATVRTIDTVTARPR